MPETILTSTCGTGNFTSDLCSGTTKGCTEASGSGGLIAQLSGDYAECQRQQLGCRSLPAYWFASECPFLLPRQRHLHRQPDRNLHQPQLWHDGYLLLDLHDASDEWLWHRMHHRHAIHDRPERQCE